MKVEVSNRSLESLYVRHINILQTNVRKVKHNMQLHNSFWPAQVRPLHSLSYPWNHK
jgi:hypothetical protein